MKPFSEWTVADVEAHNARIGVPAGSVQQVGAGQTGKTITTSGWHTATESSQPSKSKYRNVKTLADGILFDSQREAECWLVLRVREQRGEIYDLRRQVDLPLFCPVRHDSACDKQVAEYRADFVYKLASEKDMPWIEHVVDAKGYRTRMYALKKKWLELQDGIIIEEV